MNRSIANNLGCNDSVKTLGVVTFLLCSISLLSRVTFTFRVDNYVQPDISQPDIVRPDKTRHYI